MLIDLDGPIASWLLPNRCLLCSCDVPHEILCLPCRSFCNIYPNRILDSDNHSAVFWFELTIKDLIKNAKFNKNVLHLHVLRKLLEEEISPLLQEIERFSPEAIAFVPNHWFHRIMRSIELPSFFAQFLSTKLNVPVISPLKKNYLQRQATKKSKKERERSIKGAFTLKQNSTHFSRILLVDDIVTTGATFNEIKRLFSNTEIRCVAIAKTP